MEYRLGVDVGGTFTDFVLVDHDGRITEAKVPSRPNAPGEALREGIGHLAAGLGQDPGSLLARCALIIHGTTVATNALIQRRGAHTGLLSTAGFRDTLQMREGYKERRYDFFDPAPPPLVPRYLRLPVTERVLRDGEVLTPLVEDDVRHAAAVFRREGVAAVAVCFLWSFLNPAHERRAGEILREELPDAYLSLSVDVLPEIREYDRVSTTAMNAFLGPVLVRYVDDIESMLRSLGYGGAIRYTQCSGGVVSGAVLRRRPVMSLNSGPASAPAAGRHFGSHVLGVGDVLTVDMGGTSFDVCLTLGGSPAMVKHVDVERYRLGVPMVEVNAVGAGGGSIASVDAGLLRVGPRSAEAVPGPACYGRGGTEPTVSDANAVLGYLNPEGLLGGRLPIDLDAARRAIEVGVATPLGVSAAKAASDVFSLVNENMVNAIREVSVERGHDPRDFTLVVAGGAGPIHAASLARALGIRQVIVPRVASTFCAFGSVVADVRHEYSTSYITRFAGIDVTRLAALFAEMEAQGFAELDEDGVSAADRRVVRSLEMRYLDQIHEVAVDLPAGGLTAEGLPMIEELFHQRHERLYTYCERDHGTELINVRTAVLGLSAPIALGAAESPAGNSPAPLRTRRVLFEGAADYVDAAVYDGAAFPEGASIAGPAVVEEPNTAIVVPPGGSLELRPGGAYLLQLAGEAL